MRLMVRSIGILVLVAVVGGMGLSGCGGLVNKAVEKAVQEATGDSSAKVEVDTGSGSVSISGDNGQTQINTGDNAKIPEGFPDIALPEGAKVTQSIALGVEKGQSHMVAFSCPLSSQDAHDHFLKALADAGYTIDNKLEFNGSDGKLGQFSIWASNSVESVVVMGNKSTSGEGDAFTIQVVPK